jgi:hypothetical protein
MASARVGYPGWTGVLDAQEALQGLAHHADNRIDYQARPRRAPASAIPRTGAELIPTGKLTPMHHPYLFGGGISGVLIAGTVFASVSSVAVISQTDLPGSTSPLSTPPHGSLTIAAGRGILGQRPGRSSVKAPATAPTLAHTPGTASGLPTSANAPKQGSHGAPVGSSEATGRTNIGVEGGSQHGGPTPANPGQGGQGPAAGEHPADSGSGQVPPTAEPPGLAKKPGGQPPGLAKKPGGLPPGQAKKPGGLPPGHARQ